MRMIWIKPSKVSGTLNAPASKSMTLRAVAAAALSEGTSLIKEPSFCDDALAGFGIAEALGARVEKGDKEVLISGKASLSEAVLECRESGLCIRMFAPIAALSKDKILLTATGSLSTRPMSMLENPLRRLGASCKTRGGFPPIEVRGPLKSGNVVIDGSTSSQFLTGLLCALPLCPGDSEIQAVNLKSKPYVAMTVDLLSAFGAAIEPAKDFERFTIKGGKSYKSASYRVEGDWSGAAFLLVAGAVAGRVIVNNLQSRSLQPDKKILDVLDAAGAGVTVVNDSVAVEKRDLKSFQFDATDCPDLFPPLAALACNCPGRTTIHGVERLKHKESDRATALLSALSALGVHINLEGNRMEITGGRIKGGRIDSFGDHRIAMAGSVLALNAEESVGISGWRCVSKSYPAFFQDLELIREDQI